MEFIGKVKDEFKNISDLIFAELKSTETVNLSLHGEQTDFIRFNGNKVRQTTHVEQVSLTMFFQFQGKTVSLKWPLTLDRKADRGTALLNLGRARLETEALPIDPHQVPIENHGHSEQDFKGDYPSAETLIETITTTAEGTDLAGLLCLGPVIAANRNSLGQSHWFSTSTFFMDYSLYNGPQAVKACYADSIWNQEKWLNSLANAKNQLALMSRPVQKIKPGSYRVYIAPTAVSELVGTISWGGLSQRAFQRGASAFKKLGEKSVQLSEKLTFKENFDLGLKPRFNSLGELAQNSLCLIEHGKHIQFLTSSRTAKEFSVASNAADEQESLRSPEILPGNLASEDILKKLDTGLYLSNLHYINWSDQMTARVTGMTRYACFWVEKGEIIGPIQDLRFDNSFYDIWGSQLEDLTNFQEIDPAIDTYYERAIGGKKIPGMLISSFKFTL